jgi:hypothetical protein
METKRKAKSYRVVDVSIYVRPDGGKHPRYRIEQKGLMRPQVYSTEKEAKEACDVLNTVAASGHNRNLP